MKKFLLFLVCSVVSFLLVSCGHYPDGTSVYAKGGWVIPFILLAMGFVFMIVSFKAANSNSKINPIYGGGDGGNVPFWKTGWPIFMIGFWVGFIVYIAVQNGEK